MIAFLEPFARAALVAVAAGIAGAALIALATALIARCSKATATTQHVLWWIAFVASAALPVASLAISLGRIEHHTAQPAPAIRTSAAHVRAGRVRAVAVPALRTTNRVETVAHVAPVATRSSDIPSAIAGVAALPGIATVLVAVAIGVAAIRTIVLGLGLVTLLRIKRNAVALDDAVLRKLRRYRHTSRTGRGATVAVSADVDVPVAVGFGAPAILLPVAVAQTDDATDLDQIVMHEYAHLNRYDDVTNFIQCFLQGLCWFNPVMAYAGRQIALQREIACDDSVVAHTGRAHRYATCLWKLVESSHLPSRRVVAPGALFTPRQITKRIEQLLDARRNALPRLSPLTAVLLAALCAALIVVQAQRAPVIAVEDPCPPVSTAVRAAARNAALSAERAAEADRSAQKAFEASARAAALADRSSRAAGDAALKHSVARAERASHDGERIAVAAAALGTSVGLDVARQVSEAFAGTAQAPEIERQIARAKDEAARQIAFGDDEGTGGGVRTLRPFRRIEAEGSVDVVVRRGSHSTVDFQNDAGLAAHTRTVVSGDTLSIDQTDDWSSSGRRTIVVTTPTLDAVDIDGSSNVDVERLQTAMLHVRISGSGDLSASGSAGSVDVALEGSGNVDLLGVRADAIDVSSEGSGNVKVLAPANLHVRIDGSGDVAVRGDAKHVTSEINGSGTLGRI